MGYISLPYRVTYESKSFTGGLNNIRAVVLKPDNSLAGPFNLIEMPPPLSGRYYFDFITGSTDPEGEYIAAIVSPTENFQTTTRISLYVRPASQVSLDNATTIIFQKLDNITDNIDFITANVI